MPTPDAYALSTDLSNPALGLPARALEKIAADDLDQGLEAASRIADGYLTSRYVLPITTWGHDLRLCVCSIAAYHLLSGRGFNPEGADENMRLRFEDAMRWLREVNKGVVTPVGITDSSSPPEDHSDAGAALVLYDQPRGWY
jgi:phage gp36-like protein